MRTLIAAVVVGLGLTQQAQEVTVETVIPMQQRQGTFQSGSLPVTQIPSQGTNPGTGLPIRVVTMRVDIASADYVDPAASIWFRIFHSGDSGATWRHIAGAKWVGGPYVDENGTVNPMPTLTVDLGNIPTHLVRVEVDIPVRIRVGATLIY